MKKSVLRLFIIFFKIGAFTFGGGYAMIPLIRQEIVEANKWLEDDEFLDCLAICQSTPGALAVNNAVFIGYKISGKLGALMAALGVILPSFFIILLIAASFTAIQSYSFISPIFTGVRASVVALIFTAGIRLMKVSLFNIVIILLSFVSISFFNINPFIIVLLSASIGIAKSYRKEV